MRPIVFFKNNQIRLLPNHTINIDGRKFAAAYDLGAALDFVQKSTTQNRYLIWIDDLELWSNPEYSLGQNVRKLSQFVDRYAGRFFFLASMGNWTKSHLDQTHKLYNVFQAEINLDSMKFADILETILVRHGATHQALLDHTGKEASPSHFKKSVANIYKKLEGNVGGTLYEWAVSIRQLDEEQVVYEARKNVLPA